MFAAAPLSTWDPETVRAVAVAYRRQRQAGESDLPAYQAALAAYLDRHPREPDQEAADDVSGMIASVAREHGKWFWRRVGEPRR